MCFKNIRGGNRDLGQILGTGGEGVGIWESTSFSPNIL